MKTLNVKNTNINKDGNGSVIIITDNKLEVVVTLKKYYVTAIAGGYAEFHLGDYKYLHLGEIILNNTVWNENEVYPNISDCVGKSKLNTTALFNNGDNWDYHLGLEEFKFLHTEKYNIKLEKFFLSKERRLNEILRQERLEKESLEKRQAEMSAKLLFRKGSKIILGYENILKSLLKGGVVYNANYGGYSINKKLLTYKGLKNIESNYTQLTTLNIIYGW